MGLACTATAHEAERVIEELADFVSAHCNLAEIAELASEAPPLPHIFLKARERALPEKRPVIGVVRDKALWFYYPENLAALEGQGARIRFLSLFEDLENWRGLDGLYLGGGFPEDHADAISASPALALLAEYTEAGLPIYAECGGMILLGTEFEREGKKWPMAGVFPMRTLWSARPSGLGYVEAKVACANPWYREGSALLGHEFHYSICDGEDGSACLKLKRGTGLFRNGQKVDGLVKNRTWASYLHIFAPAVPQWASRFVELATRQ